MEKKNISRAERITVEVLLKDCIGTVNPLFYLFFLLSFEDNRTVHFMI